MVESFNCRNLYVLLIVSLFATFVVAAKAQDTAITGEVGTSGMKEVIELATKLTDDYNASRVHSMRGNQNAFFMVRAFSGISPDKILAPYLRRPVKAALPNFHSLIPENERICDQRLLDVVNFETQAIISQNVTSHQVPWQEKNYSLNRTWQSKDCPHYVNFLIEYQETLDNFAGQVIETDECYLPFIYYPEDPGFFVNEPIEETSCHIALGGSIIGHLLLATTRKEESKERRIRYLLATFKYAGYMLNSPSLNDISASLVIQECAWQSMLTNLKFHLLSPEDVQRLIAQVEELDLLEIDSSFWFARSMKLSEAILEQFLAGSGTIHNIPVWGGGIRETFFGRQPDLYHSLLVSELSQNNIAFDEWLKEIRETYQRVGNNLQSLLRGQGHISPVQLMEIKNFVDELRQRPVVIRASIELMVCFIEEEWVNKIVVQRQMVRVKSDILKIIAALMPAIVGKSEREITELLQERLAASVDPFGGEPYRFRINSETKELVIYSVGSDFKDNSGHLGIWVKDNWRVNDRFDYRAGSFMEFRAFKYNAGHDLGASVSYLQ